MSYESVYGFLRTFMLPCVSLDADLLAWQDLAPATVC